MFSYLQKSLFGADEQQITEEGEPITPSPQQTTTTTEGVAEEVLVEGIEETTAAAETEEELITTTTTTNTTEIPTTTSSTSFISETEIAENLASIIDETLINSFESTDDIITKMAEQENNQFEQHADNAHFLVGEDTEDGDDFVQEPPASNGKSASYIMELGEKRKRLR